MVGLAEIVGWEGFEMFELEQIELGNFEIGQLEQVEISHFQKAELD